MARFANPLFGDASRQLEIFNQNRLRAPILEGQLRSSLASSRRQNALAGLSEQTFGSRNTGADLAAAGPGNMSISDFQRALASSFIRGGDTRDVGFGLGSVLSAPDTDITQEELDRTTVATGVRNAGGTFTGLDRTLAERSSRAAARGARGRGSSGGLSAGGRSALERNLRRLVTDADGEGFTGADDIFPDALDAVTSLMEQGMPENEALSTIIRSIEVNQPSTGGDRAGNPFTRNLPEFVGGIPNTEIDAVDAEIAAANAGRVTLGDTFGEALTGDHAAHLPEPGDPGADAVSSGSDPGAGTNRGSAAVVEGPRAVGRGLGEIFEQQGGDTQAPERALPPGVTEEDFIQKAKLALQNGTAQLETVLNLFSEMGIDSSVLDQSSSSTQDFFGTP